MPNTRLYKNMQVDGDIAPYRIVTLNAERLAEQATAPESVMIGTADELGKQTNDTVDVAMSDIPEVESGAVIAVGDPLTADAQGRAVKATATGQRIIGFAFASASGAGEIIDYIYSPGFFAGEGA